MKNIVWFSVLLVAVSANAGYAQESSEVSKKLGVYICGGSGNINPNSDPQFKGTGVSSKMLDSWSEMGITYAQNFVDAKWLTITTTVALVGAIDSIHIVDGKFFRNEGTGGVTGFGKVKFDMTDYYYLSINTYAGIETGLQYSLKFADIHSIKFSTALELSPVAGYLNSELKTGNLISLYQVRLDYSVKFHENWGYNTNVRFRFKGDSAEEFKNNFNVRYNNSLNYSNSNGMGGYIELRYHPLVKATGTVHDVMFNTGISYSFDLAKL